MGAKVCCFGDPNYKTLPEKYSEYQHVSLTTSIINFIIKRRFFSTAVNEKQRRRRRKLPQQEKKPHQLEEWILVSPGEEWILQPFKCTNQATLKEWILASPSNIKSNKIKSCVLTTRISSPLNKCNTNIGNENNGPTVKQLFSSHVNDNPSGEGDFEGFNSKSRGSSTMDVPMKIQEGHRGEVEDSLWRRNQSGKKIKKVSFKLPKLGDIFLLDSPDACFESY